MWTVWNEHTWNMVWLFLFLWKKYYYCWLFFNHKNGNWNETYLIRNYFCEQIIKLLKTVLNSRIWLKEEISNISIDVAINTEELQRTHFKRHRLQSSSTDEKTLFFEIQFNFIVCGHFFSGWLYLYYNIFKYDQLKRHIFH